MRGIAYDTNVRRVPMIVLDSNVLVAALRSSRGASFALLSLVGTDAFEIAVSVPVILEYEEVLLRESGRSPSVVGDVIDYVCSVAKHQSIFFLWRPRLPDPDDEMLLELAVAAGCDAIVTHNTRDFGPADEFGLRVLSPAVFLKEIGEVR